MWYGLYRVAAKILVFSYGYITEILIPHEWRVLPFYQSQIIQKAWFTYSLFRKVIEK